ncbi:class I SAM-dependent methyltransferase [Mesobacillus foraminis]|uniref:class I SAM-dependent methyltransferase n=1 Tax=Mesobacillus foraminis TaxID=279826 RepID=UPI000EF45BDA|nr:class I SAM-dependent methyltransferase [Mesobacillus foraminis]
MDEKENVRRQFGANAANYVTSPSHARGQDLEKVVEMISIAAPGGELLDIATGGGHVANALAPFYQKVTALDLTPQMLKKAQAFIKSNGVSNVSFVQGDAEKLPFPDESFTTVTCRIAAHHFPDIAAFVKEAYRVLKANGLFILVDNVGPERNELDYFYNLIEKKRDASHVRAHKKTEWISLMEHQGFDIHHMTTFKKNFIFKNWCEMMRLPEEEQNELSGLMKSAPEHIRIFFDIKINENTVQSFEGQSMLIAAQRK